MKYKPAGIVLIIRDDGTTEVLVGPETFGLGDCPSDDTISSPVISSITVVMKGWTILTVCTWFSEYLLFDYLASCLGPKKQGFGPKINYFQMKKLYHLNSSTVCQKVSKSDFQSEFSISRII